jgi:hypothetical protein
VLVLLCTYYLLLPTIGTAIDVVLIGVVLQRSLCKDQTRPDHIRPHQTTGGFDSQFWHSAKCGLPSSAMLLLVLLVLLLLVVVVVVVVAGSLKNHSFVGPMASSSIHHTV